MLGLIFFLSIILCCDFRLAHQYLLFDSDTVIFTNTFENKDDLSKNIWGIEAANNHSIMRSSEQAKSGSHSAKIVINRTDTIIANSRRSELVLPSDSNLNRERWYGFSIFLPASYVSDPTPESIFQFHDVPDIGETVKAPPISMQTINGNYLLKVFWDNKDITRYTEWQEVNYYLGKYSVNTWTDWVIRVKFSHGQDGLIELWKNDSLIVRRSGPNCYNDKILPYFKIGFNKWPWLDSNNTVSTTFQRIMYVDELRVGNQEASYSLVVPTQNN